MSDQDIQDKLDDQPIVENAPTKVIVFFVRPPLMEMESEERYPRSENYEIPASPRSENEIPRLAPSNEISYTTTAYSQNPSINSVAKAKPKPRVQPVPKPKPTNPGKGSNGHGGSDCKATAADPNNGGSSSGSDDKGTPAVPPPYNMSVRPRPDPVDPSITLSSVGGLDEHIRYLRRAVMYPLKHKGSLSSWGVEPPKGIMFHGPPGTGKTLMAKALANELSQSLNKKFSFFYQKGGECFDKYFGESQKKLRELFYAANHYKPSIIFFDEIDGLCPDRSTSGQSSEAYATVVTALLGLIDSVKRGEVFIIGATNRLDAVDPAIRRPGRFDKQLSFSLPCEDGRKHILGIHTNDWPRDKPTGDLLISIVKRTNGYTGADLEKVCRDTIVAAMSRSGGIPSLHLRITRDDWSSAVQNMKHSNTNVFGSSMYIASPIPHVMAPLVSNIVQEILILLKPMIPEDCQITFPGSGNRPGDIPQTRIPELSRKSLLVWERNPTNDNFTNNAIMRGVLSDPSLGKMTTFILNEETLLTNTKSTNTLMGSMNNVLTQVLSCDKPCILFIPRIHVLENTMTELKMEKTFYRQLMRLRGPNVILVATSVGDLVDHSDEIADLFIGQRRSYNVRMPFANERKQFYLQIFGELIGNDGVPNKKQKTCTKKVGGGDEDFERLLGLAVELTELDTLDNVLTLHDALTRKKVDWKNGTINLTKLSEDLEYLLDKYSKTKLQ